MVQWNICLLDVFMMRQFKMYSHQFCTVYVTFCSHYMYLNLIQHWPGFIVNAFSNEAYLDGFVKVRINLD